MKSFATYLIPLVNENDFAGVQARIMLKIKEVPENLFYLPTLGDFGIKHFVLELTSMYKFTGEDDSSEVFKGIAGGTEYPLRFFYSGDKEPSMRQFEDHIKKECNAAILAIKGNSNLVSPTSEKFRLQRDRFELNDVYKFTKILNKDYSKTEHFIEDFDYWLDRLYNTLKWISYMKGDDDWYGAYVAIGDRLYDFLGVAP